MCNISSVLFLLALMAVSGTTAQNCGQAAGGALCASNLCCSKYGYCGSTSEYCGSVCQSQCNNTNTNITTTECGTQSGNALCTDNACCSEFGYCGVTSAYCGSGCQSQCSSNTTAAAPSSSSKKLVVPLAIAVPLAVFIPATIAYFFWLKRRKILALTAPQWDSKCVEAPIPRFSYGDLSTATKGFSENLMLGKGAYGSVYKGILPSDGTEVAVKMMSVQVHQQFAAELSVIGLLRHKNLVGLKGWCHENQKSSSVT